MRRLTLGFVALLLLAAGCRGKPVVGAIAAPEPALPEASPHGERREGEAGEAMPRLSPEVVWNDPKDDPELTDEYYGDAAEEDGGTPASAPVPRPSAQALPADRSFSIGPPNGGWLINAKALPLRGPAHRVLPGTVERSWFYGTDGLVRLIQQGAAAVAAQFPGAVLRLGNLSRQEGGKITPSVSHQSGRDADIGLYVTDLDGNAVDAPGFPKFDGSRGPDVDTTGRYLFDVARNWAFVEALLSDDRARIQWIFLDTPLKAMLIDFAIRKQRTSQLIDKAEKVIVRPKNSSPHANHFHIRIFCSAGDLDYGCRDYGPEWSWVKAEREADDQAIDGIIDRIMAGEKGLLRLDDGDDSEPAPPSEPGEPPPESKLPLKEPKDPPTDVEIKL